jgi:regulatory protein
MEQLCAKAEAYCATAEHCIWEVRHKLQQWEATPEQEEKIIAHLQEARFIDEQRYCNAFVHDKLLYQGWGRVKIRTALYSKHLPQQYIYQALDSIDESEYFNTLKRVIESKKRAIKSCDPMAREKLIRFCLQRGFTYDEIESLI